MALGFRLERHRRPHYFRILDQLPQRPSRSSTRVRCQSWRERHFRCSVPRVWAQRHDIQHYRARPNRRHRGHAPTDVGAERSSYSEHPAPAIRSRQGYCRCHRVPLWRYGQLRQWSLHRCRRRSMARQRRRPVGWSTLSGICCPAFGGIEPQVPKQALVSYPSPLALQITASKISDLKVSVDILSEIL